jgi:O-antigen/teichoic acid export membrane protein
LTVSNGLNLGVSAVIGLLLARSLGPAKFGLYSAITVAAAIVINLTSFGLNFHLLTQLQNDRSDKDRYSSVLRASYLITLPAALCWLVLSLSLLHGTTRTATVIEVGEIVFSPLALARNNLLTRAQQRGITGAAAVGRATWAGGVAAIVVIGLTNPLPSLMAVRGIAVLSEGVTLIWLARMPFFTWVRGYWNHARESLSILRVSVPLAVSQAAGTGFNRIDQLLLVAMRGPFQTGLYGAGTRIAEAFGAIAPIVQSVSLPGMVELQRRRDEAGFTAAIRDSLLLMLLPGGLFAALLIPDGGRLGLLALGGSYRGTGPIIAILAAAEWVTFLGTVYGSAAMAVNARRWLMWAAVAGFVVNVGANVAFIPRYGAIAAAWASLAGYTVAALLPGVGTSQLRRCTFGTIGVPTRVIVAMAFGITAGFTASLPLFASLTLVATVYLLATLILFRNETRRLRNLLQTERAQRFRPRGQHARA